MFYSTVSQSSSPVTMHINCDNPINAMDLNRDASKAVVAGRNGEKH